MIILNRTKRKKTFHSSFKDSENINDKITIANKFNIFFTNIGPTLAAEIVTIIITLNLKMLITVQ